MKKLTKEQQQEHDDLVMKMSKEKDIVKKQELKDLIEKKFYSNNPTKQNPL